MVRLTCDVNGQWINRLFIALNKVWSLMISHDVLMESELKVESFITQGTLKWLCNFYFVVNVTERLGHSVVRTIMRIVIFDFIFLDFLSRIRSI